MDTQKSLAFFRGWFKFIFVTLHILNFFLPRFKVTVGEEAYEQGTTPQHNVFLKTISGQSLVEVN
jgi:hypothetical protein